MQIGGEEFVITQIADPNDTDFNSHKVLLAELELLVKGAYMKAAFDHYAEECKVSVPSKLQYICSMGTSCLIFHFVHST